ncbi:hypothetical protein HanIR_Chr16g0837201 [Helianthus annuus]|nr:hypothetical protein HanIR_Chr16g0837201 [Helianthus annuus]
MEIPNQIRHKILQMKKSQTRTRTYPSSSTKRHHFDLFASTYIKHIVIHQEPLWLKLHGFIPDLGVPAHLRHRANDRGTLGDRVTFHFHLLPYPMG